jgi:hypothetical protein
MAVLVPKAELGASGPEGSLAAALTAIDELNDARAASPELPRVVAVACADDDQAALATLSGPLAVRIFIGPTRGTAIRPASDTINGRGALFAPFADGPNLATQDLATNVVSCTANRRDSYAAVIAAANFLRAPGSPLKVTPDGPTALTLSSDEVELGFGNPFAAKPLGETVLFGADAKGLKGALDAQPAWPGLVLAASAENSWSDNIKAIESESVATGQPVPNYLLIDQQANMLSLLNEANTQAGSRAMPARQPSSSLASPPATDSLPSLVVRVFGLAYHVDQRNTDVDSAFRAAFSKETGHSPDLEVASDPHAGPDLNRVYDCTYLAIYAALGAQVRFALTPDELSAPALIVGLRALVGKRDRPPIIGTQPVTQPCNVGADAVSDVLAALKQGGGADSTVALTGASGNFDLPVFSVTADQVIEGDAAKYLSPAAPDEDLYCYCSGTTFYRTGVSFSAIGTLRVTKGACSCM